MTVIWTSFARAQLRSLHRYIAESSPTAAKQQVKRIQSLVEFLSSFPKMGKPGRVPDTREFVVPQTPYVVAYQIAESDIIILAVFHGAQRWPASFPYPQKR